MFEVRGETLFCVFGRKSIAYGISQKTAGAIQVQLRDGSSRPSLEAQSAPGEFQKLPIRAVMHFTDVVQIDGVIGCLQLAKAAMEGK